MGTITTAATGHVVASWPAMQTVKAPAGAATFEAVHEAFLNWFDCNLKAAHGYEINGNEIYWFTLDGIPSWTAVACAPAAVTFGICQGNEGWQVRGFCRGKATARGAVEYWPVLTAKVWTLGAACQLIAALTEATADLFDITAA
jgi:hypothetical protein